MLSDAIAHRANGSHKLTLVGLRSTTSAASTCSSSLPAWPVFLAVSGSGKSNTDNVLVHAAPAHNLAMPVPPGWVSGPEGDLGARQSDRDRPTLDCQVNAVLLGDFYRSFSCDPSGSRHCGPQVPWLCRRRDQLQCHGVRFEACSVKGVHVIQLNFLSNFFAQCGPPRALTSTLRSAGQALGPHTRRCLQMTVEQGSGVISAIPQAADRLRTLLDVAFGYAKLVQPAPLPLDVEPKLVNLLTQLSKRATGNTLHLIDEPTTGLSFYDVHRLMDVMQRLVDKGNSILVIEHNLDVIRCSDWIIDLGPEGGEKGGEIVVTGTPEEVAEHPSSHTGRYLKQVLEQHPPEPVAA